MMNPRQLAELVEAQGAALVLFARQWSATPEDLVQEAFLRLIRQRTPPREPLAWLYRVVRNAGLDERKGQRRRQQREAQTARPESWFTPQSVAGAEATAAVAALGELPLEQRECIVAHLWGGLTFEQLGELLGVAASTAYRRFEAGLARLRTRLNLPAGEERT